MIVDTPFSYRPICSSPGCDRTAKFKIAASWSDGTSREFKSYGIVCEEHREAQVEAARLRSARITRTADEIVGPVEVFVLKPGSRDTELTRHEDRPD